MAFEFHLPDIGEGVIEGEIVSWKVAEGDIVELDQPIVEVMTDKATVEIPSPRAGRIAKINFGEGEICPVGDVLLVIDTGGGATASAPTTTAKPNNGHAAPAAVAPAVHSRQHENEKPRVEVIDASADRARVKATPATRRLARTLEVELARVPASGRNGRITTEDVRQFAESGGAGAAMVPAISARAIVPAGQMPVAIARTEHEERIPFRGMRRRIADSMVRSKFTATHFTYVEEVDVTDLVTVRERARERAAERGLKLTYLPFIIKAVVTGLKKWPQLNASLDESTSEIVRKHYYHIGIAAQSPQGLVVSVVRDADKRSIFDISTEIDRLAKAVQSGSATREDLTGSTFTISSLGKLGGILATPIINFPEVGIIGVHKIAERPAVVNKEIVIRSMMNLSISLDHRLVDGWDGAMFLQDVKSLLEDPTLMFMEMV
ncbi:MAG TPA: dihydrolipoamide acetyltransferase family protein [Kofleriaceae bacterium]|nr:dihydrolipoamide acetyltransferase family protein [Kofleriaceae bacterium]